MIKRLPIIPTIIVVAAAAVMVWLGFWQLGRAEEKGEMLKAYAQASNLEELADFPFEGSDQEFWFRKSSVDCVNVTQIEALSGTAATGQKGWAYRATCRVASVPSFVLVDLGYSRDLIEPVWQGGPVTGIIAPGRRLVADPALAELAPLAKPDPNELPNNHLAYAGQWFFFALTALVIFWFAVRSRLSKRD